MCLNLIKTGQMKTTKSLIAAYIPYYSIYLYLKVHFIGLSSGCYSKKDAMFMENLLEDDRDVYRQHDKLLSWPVVQLYRNLLIATVKSFVINPMYRTLAFLPIFSTFLLHDRSAKPFQNKVVNILQTSSTTCLCVIVICNIIFSFSLFMSNIESILHMETVLAVLSYTESIVYFIFPLMLPVSILWRKYAKKDKEE